MPQKKWIPKKRKPYKKRYKKSYTSVIVKSPSITPDRYMCKLKYGDTMSFTAINLNAHQFRLNSVFDPDYTGAGHQPKGFDQLAELYNRYIVTGCKVEIDASCLDTTANILAIEANDDSSLFTRVDELVESARVSYKVLSPATGQDRARLKRYYSMKRLSGKKSVIANNDLDASVTTNPSDIYYLNVYVGQIDGSFAAVHTDFIIKLTYYVTFLDRVNIGQS